MKIFNTPARKIVEFKPIEDTVGVYNCGPTVYDYAHIGNLRAFLFADLLRRTLEFSGYKVKQVMNITDVGHLVSDADEGEDKIEKGAKRENKSAFDIARFYEEQFKSDIKELNIAEPSVMPRATEHIAEQIELVEILEENGYAYKIRDGIYFDTSKFKDYGKMANLDLEGMKEGIRVEQNPEKRNASDFALWKFSYDSGRPFDATRDDASLRRQMEWDSPWGTGFPGWHIECSAMSVKYLGQPFDIHTGGIDHIPVHHTNEIAQSEAAFDKPLSDYWMHSEFLTVDGQKMSKSLNNFYTLRDIKAKGYSPLDFRYLCLQAHYRSKLNFTWGAMEAARNARTRLANIAGQFSSKMNLDGPEGSPVASSLRSSYMNKFKEKIESDLNTPEALAVVWEMLRDEKLGEVEKSLVLREIDDKILGLDLFKVDEVSPLEIRDMLLRRSQAKADKDYQLADKIRGEIESFGWIVEDGADGSRLIKK